jgi:hypothetical protein
MISFVTFRRPFCLAGLEGEQPAGTYMLRREQQAVDMMTPSGWWRTAITIEMRRGGATEQIAIDGRELRAALSRDSDPVFPPAGDDRYHAAIKPAFLLALCLPLACCAAPPRNYAGSPGSVYDSAGGAPFQPPAQNYDPLAPQPKIDFGNGGSPAPEKEKAAP